MNAAGAAAAKPSNVAAHLESVARAGRVGRRVGIAVYLLCLGYIVVVGFGTFIEGIFGVPETTSPSSRVFATNVSCDDARSELASSLRDASADLVTTGNRNAHRAALALWDDRLGSIRTRCNDSRTRELEFVRHRVEIQVRRYDRENGAALRRLGTSHTASTATESSR